MRDIIVFRCDTCDRTIEKIRKINGLETVGRCVITDNCRGHLYSEKLIQTIAPYIKRTPNDPELDNFYPKNRIYRHSQNFNKEEWVVNHNLGAFPIVSVYSSDGERVAASDYTVDHVDKSGNTSRFSLIIRFTELVSGVAHLYIRESIDSIVSEAVASDISPVRISANGSTGSISILVPTPIEYVTDEYDDKSKPVTEVKFKLTSPTGQISFLRIDLLTKSNGSPWNVFSEAIIKNKRYYIGHVELFTDGFNTSMVSDGTIMEVADDSEIKPVHVLLADEPYESADIVRDKILPVSAIGPLAPLFFDNDHVFCDNAAVSNVYPNLILS